MAITVPRERRTFVAAPVPVARGMPSRCGAATRVAGGDVVVTDLNMPEQCGLWLWRQTMIVRPELRGRFVLIASDPRHPRGHAREAGGQESAAPLEPGRAARLS